MGQHISQEELYEMQKNLKFDKTSLITIYSILGIVIYYFWS